MGIKSNGKPTPRVTSIQKKFSRRTVRKNKIPPETETGKYQHTHGYQELLGHTLCLGSIPMTGIRNAVVIAAGTMSMPD